MSSSINMSYPSYCVYADNDSLSMCSNILYKCNCRDCYKFICKECISKQDAIVYSDKNKIYIICLDCQPHVAINLETNIIRFRHVSSHIHQTETQQSSLTSRLISKCGFTPLSSKISAYVVAAAVATAAAVASSAVAY